MSEPASPALSVVLYVVDEYAAIARTLRHLAAQTISDQIEVVIGVPDSLKLDLSQAPVTSFWAVVLAPTVEAQSPEGLYAAAIRRASARLVAFGEDHSFPTPQWAEALVRAHAEHHAAVGPVIHNANPETGLSWANLFLDFGPWLAPASVGPMPGVPAHNSCYRRELLLQQGERLVEVLLAEGLLQGELRRQGHTLVMAPGAETYHLNHSRLWPALRRRFSAGAAFGAYWSRDWSLPRKWLYVAASPLIPWVRYWRVLQEARKPGRPWGRFLRTTPWLVLLLLVDTLGEVAGYFWPQVGHPVGLLDLERRRTRYLRAAEQAQYKEG